MRMVKILLTFVLLVWSATDIMAQKKPKIDSALVDSFHEATENLLIQEFQQQQFDSIVKVNLQNELEQAIGNKQRTKELEAKLKEVAFRDSVRKSKQLNKIAALKQNTIGFPVVPFNDTLFYIYTKIGAFSARDRAKAINQRIQKIYDDPFYVPDSLRINDFDGASYDILYNNETQVLSVTTIDALWLEVDGGDLAKDYLNKIKVEIATERGANSIFNWLKKLGFVLLIVIGLSLVVYLINYLFRKLKDFLLSNKEKYLKQVSFRNIKLLNETQFQSFVLKFTNIIRLLVIVFTVYLSLPLLFSIFPATKDLTNTMLGWVMSPIKSTVMGVIQFIPNLVTITVIYFIFRYSIRAIRYFIYEIERGNLTISGFHADWAMPTFNIMRFLLYAFMVVLIFPYLPGAGSTAFQGVSVFIGVLFSLGSSSAISNMIAGVVITYMRPFKIGDRIKIGETVGDVLEKNMLVTRIRTTKNEEITIPNSAVLASNTINYTANTKAENDGLILYTTVTIGYDVPWKLMHETLIQAALLTDYVLKEPKPFVLQTSLDDFYVSYQINVYTKEASKQNQIYSLLHQHIQDCCNGAGIEIMSPHYRAERDGNPTTIPSLTQQTKKEE
jgi:small-conductance mechanosensitive channel